MALLLGGGVATWWALRRARDRPTTDAALGLAGAYERLFWPAIGVLVATGVGNLGAIAPAVPTRGAWALTLAVKLAAVLALLPLSIVRTVGYGRVRGLGRPDPETLRRLRLTYAATVLVLAGVLALAEVLAHG